MTTTMAERFVGESPLDSWSSDGDANTLPLMVDYWRLNDEDAFRDIAFCCPTDNDYLSAHVDLMEAAVALA